MFYASEPHLKVLCGELDPCSKRDHQGRRVLYCKGRRLLIDVHDLSYDFLLYDLSHTWRCQMGSWILVARRTTRVEGYCAARVLKVGVNCCVPFSLSYAIRSQSSMNIASLDMFSLSTNLKAWAKFSLRWD